MKKALIALALVAVLFCWQTGAAFADLKASVTWDMDALGTLTVSGSGEMPDYATTDPPWASKLDKVWDIVICDGVTEIGNWAFADSSARSVTIPDSVKEIGRAAFKRSAELKTVELPSGVEELEDECFYGCEKLETVVISRGVTDIGDSAFYGCASLESVSLPASLEEVEASAFQGCTKLKTVYYAGTEAQWSKVDIKGYNRPLTNAEIIFGAAPPAVSGDTIVDIDAMYNMIVGLRADGTVAVAKNYWPYETDSWTDIVAVAACESFVVGLKADGTVATAGADGYDFSDWTDVTAIDGTYYYAVGLKSDGTVLAEGDGDFGLDSLKQAENMKLVRVAVSSEGYATSGLRADGAAYTSLMAPDNWFAEDVVDISGSVFLTLALHADGSVEACGEGELVDEIAGWRDIKQVLAGDRFVIGLKKDGTVIVNKDAEGLDEVKKWTGIKELFGNNEKLVIGLKDDGTTVVYGSSYNMSEEAANEIASWRDIKKIVASGSSVAGLKADGTVVAVGYDDAVLDEIKNW